MEIPRQLGVRRSLLLVVRHRRLPFRDAERARSRRQGRTRPTPRGGGEAGDERDRAAVADRVGGDARRSGRRRRSPCRARSDRRRRRRARDRGDGVGDRGDQRRIDERGADAEQRPRPAAARPTAPSRGGEQRRAPPPGRASRRRSAACARRGPTSGRSQIWPTPQTAGIEAGDQADLRRAGAVGGEEERDQPPGERVVEVVDQAGLRAGAKRRHAVGGVARTPARNAGARPHRVGVVARLLERDVGGGVADEEQPRAAAPTTATAAAGDDEHVAGGELGRQPAAQRRGDAPLRRSRRPRSAPARSPRRFGPTRSIFITTVIDQARPWLTPSRTLAATIQPQLGATAISSGTGSAAAQPAISSRRRPTRSAQRAGAEVGERLGQPEGDDEREHRGARAEAEVVARRSAAGSSARGRPSRRRRR